MTFQSLIHFITLNFQFFYDQGNPEYLKYCVACVFSISSQCMVKVYIFVRAESSPEHLWLNGRLQQENDHQQWEEQESH